MLTRTLRAFAAFLLAATLAYSADTVELLPGKITGSITLTSDTINSGSVSASATDGSGSASSSFNGSSFSIVVPAGKTWRLSFNLSLATSSGYSQFSVTPSDAIAVGPNETVAKSFALATSRVTADVQVANGTLASFGNLQAYGSDSAQNFSAYSSGTGFVTALPMSNVNVYGGTVSLQSNAGQNSTVALSSAAVNVPLAGAVVTWNVDAAFVSSTIQGSLQLTGGPDLQSAQVYLYGNGVSQGQNLSAYGPYQFTNLQAGSYYLYSYANFATGSLYLNRSVDVAAGSVATVDFTQSLATAKMGLDLTGFLTADKLSYGYIYSYTDNASANSTLNSGAFTTVTTTGKWSFPQIELVSYFTDGYCQISSYVPNRNETTLAAGDNVTLPNARLNTTQTEFTFDVVEPGNATAETLISNPSIRGTAYRYAPNGEWLGYTSVYAQSWGTPQAKPRVLVVGEPGSYTFEAYGYVDGSNVSFGNFTIELKAPLPTPVGTNVTVEPGAGVTLQFDQVTSEGVTTISQLPVGPTLPAGYSNVTSNGAKVYYSASTTATIGGYVDVTISYDASTIAAELEAGLHLFYYDKPTETWIDITTGVDPVSNTISGVAPGLSTFAIGLPHAPVIGTIVAPVSGLAETELTFTAEFSDADAGDKHTAVWSWGSGLGNTAGVVDQSAKTITGTHTFTAGGTYTGTLTLTDSTGNVVSKEFTYTVAGGARDTVAPVISISGNLSAEASSANGAAVSFGASATDDKDGLVAVMLSRASGSIFPLGTTPVTATATDAAGNVATKTFVVTVADTIAPVLNVPASLTLEAGSAGGATATFAATASDATGATITYSAASGSTFAVGVTTVSVTATDAAGNQTTGSFTVTVRDTKAPVISSVITNAPTLWPANHKMVAVTVTVAATDLVGPITYRIVSVTSSEPDNGLGDGDTANDIEVTGAMTVNLRAERSGKGSGRTYTITVEAKDAAGNKATSTVSVVVPKSQGGK